MPEERLRRGLIDTNIVVLREWIDPADLSVETSISAVTLGELTAGVHSVQGDDAAARLERARRVAVLQEAEMTFEPLAFDATAARVYGRLFGTTLAIGRSPRRRIADLLIAATAIANSLPLFTTNPDDFAGLDEWLTVVPVTRPTAAP